MLMMKPEEEAPSTEPAHKVQANIPEHQLIELRNNISSWVAAGEYRRRDVPYKEILETLNTDAATMRVFMKSENGMDFRKFTGMSASEWRRTRTKTGQ